MKGEEEEEAGSIDIPIPYFLSRRLMDLDCTILNGS
jgi:hypothetical protein